MSKFEMKKSQMQQQKSRKRRNDRARIGAGIADRTTMAYLYSLTDTARMERRLFLWRRERRPHGRCGSHCFQYHRERKCGGNHPKRAQHSWGAHAHLCTSFLSIRCIALSCALLFMTIFAVLGGRHGVCYSTCRGRDARAQGYDGRASRGLYLPPRCSMIAVIAAIISMTTVTIVSFMPLPTPPHPLTLKLFLIRCAVITRKSLRLLSCPY